MPVQNRGVMASSYVPDPHPVIVSGRSEVLTTRAESYTGHVVLVSDQGMEPGDLSSHSLGIEVPEFGGLIPACSAETPPIRTKDHTANMVFVGLECKPFSACGRVPDRDLTVQAS